MAELIAELKQLRLNGIAHGYAEVPENSAGGLKQQTAEWLPRPLIQAEQNARGLRRRDQQFEASIKPSAETG